VQSGSIVVSTGSVVAVGSEVSIGVVDSVGSDESGAWVATGSVVSGGSADGVASEELGGWVDTAGVVVVTDSVDSGSDVESVGAVVAPVASAGIKVATTAMTRHPASRSVRRTSCFTVHPCSRSGGTRSGEVTAIVDRRIWFVTVLSAEVVLLESFRTPSMECGNVT
jgi:hypothetical protein